MDITFKTFNLINEKRALYGRYPLTWDQSLYNLCSEHCLNLSTGRAYGHDGFDYRAARIPFQYIGIAENVAYNYNKSDPAVEAVNQWMNSQGHFRNIIGDYNTSALACIKGSNGSYYFVQMFAKK